MADPIDPILGDPFRESTSAAPEKPLPPPPSVPAAMLVPAASVKRPITMEADFSTYQQNWIWAQQWKERDPKRHVIELPMSGSVEQLQSAFVAGVAKAAEKAPGGEVILFVGHGTAGDSGSPQAAFDALPEQPEHALSQHKLSITREVVDLTDIAMKQGGRWVSKDSTQTSSTKLDDLGRRFDMIEAAGKAMRGKAKTFVLLSCNVGQDLRAGGGLRLHQRLAAIMGVEVVCFSAFVATGQATDEKGRPGIQLWFKVGRTNPVEGRPDPPAAGDKEAAKTQKKFEDSFHEVQPGLFLERAAAPAPQAGT